jgi:hypothetical protein
MRMPIQLSYPHLIVDLHTRRNVREIECAECGAHSHDRSLFSMYVRSQIFLRTIFANSLRKSVNSPLISRLLHYFSMNWEVFHVSCGGRERPTGTLSA